VGEDLADLYEHAPCGYVSLAPGGRIVKINRTLTAWLGREDEALLGEPFNALLSFGGRIAFETHLAPLLRLQGHVDEIALDLVHADGSKLPMIANAAEKRDAEGDLLFTRLTLFKAIDRRTYERGLVAARGEAEARANSEHETSVLREQFIAVLGHDLRNPLAALASGIRLIGSKETLSTRGHVILHEMDASVSRALALIGNVLDFARGRLGQGIPLELESSRSLRPVLEQVVTEVRTIAPGRDIRAQLDINTSFLCDPLRLGQLVSNLLSNAVTHGDPASPIVLDAKTTLDSFVLSVGNGGASIPEEAQQRLFRPFFRGAVRASQNGLGLGLFIVSEIAKAHGGTIEVSSTEEETRFTFTMPLAPA
jgi:sigma-B regulation protein RsbU (phosphoserine phosphatase)